MILLVASRVFWSDFAIVLGAQNNCIFSHGSGQALHALHALKQSAQKQQRINPERHKSDLEHLLYAFRSEGVILEHPRSHRRIHILICGRFQDMES